MNFDRVDCFGKISVRIPQKWAEGDDEDDGGTATFFDPQENSGTLRVSLLTTNRNEQPTRETLEKEGFDCDEPGAKFFWAGDYFVTEWNNPANLEDGVHMYWWAISAIVGPKMTRKAMLSYAVPIAFAALPDFEDKLKMVRDCVFATHFMLEKTN